MNLHICIFIYLFLKAAIQQVFHPCQQGLSAFKMCGILSVIIFVAVISVKTQMCQLVTIIKSCLLLTASLFCRTSLQGIYPMELCVLFSAFDMVTIYYSE